MKCPYCSRRFDDAASARTHVKVKHPGRKLPTSPPRDDDESEADRMIEAGQTKAARGKDTP